MRNSRMTMARPSAASATVMQMVKTVKIMPVTSALNRANATRLMLTALSISSMPSRMPMVLRRVITPNNPMQNTTAASVKYGCKPMYRIGSQTGHRGTETQRLNKRILCVSVSLWLVEAKSALIVRAREVDCAHQCCQHQQRQKLERHHESREDRLPNRSCQFGRQGRSGRYQRTLHN